MSADKNQTDVMAVERLATEMKRAGGSDIYKYVVSEVLDCLFPDARTKFQDKFTSVPTTEALRVRMNEQLGKLQGEVRERKSGASDAPEDDASSRAEDKRKAMAPKPQPIPSNGFDSLSGARIEKDQLQASFIEPLLYPKLFDKAKAFLMYGPPGTGKTELTKATAGEIQRCGILVSMFVGGGSEFKGKYIGDTEKNIALFFDTAEETAKKAKNACLNDGTGNKVCPALSVLLLDEIDAIAMRRGGPDGGANNVLTTNELIRRMEGVTPYDYVCLIAATNRPWSIDDAVMRRMNATMFVNLPDHATRKAIVSQKFKKMEIVLDDDATNALEALIDATGPRNVYKKPETDDGEYVLLSDGFLPDTARYRSFIDPPAAVVSGPSTFGYSHSDMSKVFDVARRIASHNAIKEKKFRRDGLFLVPDKNVKAADLSPAERTNVKPTAAMFTKDVWDQALTRYPSTINSRQYTELIAYAVFGLAPEQLHAKAGLIRNAKAQAKNTT